MPLNEVEEKLLEVLVNRIADDSIERWAKPLRGKLLDNNAIIALRLEFARALVGVAGGVALAFTGIASESAAAQSGQKVQ